MKKIIKIMAVIFGLLLLGTGIYFYGPLISWQQKQEHTTANSIIKAYDQTRDLPAILEIFQKDWYWLIASKPEYSQEFVEYMFKNSTPNKDPRYMGKLITKVLYENDQLVGFTSYYMKNFFIGIILFVVVKPEFRGKGYAQQLMKSAIEDLKQQGASLITLVTRTTNESAQKLYKRLGFTASYDQDGFVYFELKV